MNKTGAILIIFLIIGCTSLPTQRSPAGGRGSGNARGPGSGGGTDLVKVKGSDNPVLADFKDTWSEKAIDPLTHEGIYDRVKAKIERLDYYYPGLKKQLEKVFEKTWVTTDEKFPPNASGEIKPVKQTDAFVKITRSEFNGLPDTWKEQIWVHEMVRAYVNDLTKGAVIAYTPKGNLRESKKFNAALDTIVRTITPLIYDEAKFRRLESEWTAILRDEYVFKFLTDWNRPSKFEDEFCMAGRGEMYDTIRDENLVQRYKQFCLEGASYFEDHKLSKPNTQCQMSWRFGSISHSNNVFQSDEMNAVGLFAIRTNAVISGVARGGFRYGDGINLYDSNRDMRLDVAARTHLLKFACEEAIKDGLEKQFEEYSSDNGQLRKIPTAWQGH